MRQFPLASHNLSFIRNRRGGVFRALDQPVRLGFTLIELLVVIAIIAILAGMLLPALARAKETGRRIACANNIRQVAFSLQMYADDHVGWYPERNTGPRWSERLRPFYADVRVLRCPSDGPKVPQTGVGGTNGFPGDAAPRTFIFNGWNDYFKPAIDGEKGSKVENEEAMNLMMGRSMRENTIANPTETILFGEKENESTHYYMDILEGPQFGGGTLGNEFMQLDQSKHALKANNSGAGGANYAFGDGAARFYGFGKTFNPVNLWAVLPEWRNRSVVF